MFTVSNIVITIYPLKNHIFKGNYLQLYQTVNLFFITFSMAKQTKKIKVQAFFSKEIF